MTRSTVQFRAKTCAQMGSDAPDRQEVCCWDEDGQVSLSIATADGYVTKALMTPDAAATLAECLRIRAIVARIDDATPQDGAARRPRT